MLGFMMQIMRFCGSYARRIRIAWVFAFLKALCSNAPLVLAVILITLLIEGSLTAMGCLAAFAGMAVLIVLQSVFQNLVDRLQSATGYELFAERRMELAEHLGRLPMGYFTAGNVGKISSVLSADMVYIEEQSMRILADVASDVFSQAVIVGFLFWMNPLVDLAALVTVAAAMLIARPMNRAALDDSTRRQQSIEDLTGAVLEYVAGLAVSKGFNRGGEDAHELRGAFSCMTESNLAFERNHAPWERRLLIVYALGMTAIASLCVWLYSQGMLTAGSFIGVMLFVFNLFGPIRHLYMQDAQIAIMKSCLDRLQALLDEPEIPKGEGAPLPPVSLGVPEIEFRDVTFAYGDEEVLHGISFAVETGQTVALVGQSGSGKSTVASLIARFWDVTDGCVFVRGVDVRDLAMADLMAHMGMVFQRVYLFEDTVYSNIAMGSDHATPELVQGAARKARCHDFIETLPYGYDTMIGEGGASLSGGEQQRISIARCILKDAPVIILDEATANLDADNESAIQQAMTELCHNKTSVVIAHRLNTIASADRIVVLDEGCIVEAGSHEDLLVAGGAYAHMVAAARGRKANE